MKVREKYMKLAAGMVLMVWLLAGCQQELSVEQQVIATLEKMEQAAEEGRHMDFMDYVADDFSGQTGTLDRRGFHRYMMFQINENRRLHAQFFPIYVQKADSSETTTEASARFRILITGGGGLLPERGQLFAVETAWVRAGSDWLLRKADWQPVNLSQ